jgi:hypothetical protein
MHANRLHWQLGLMSIEPERRSLGATMRKETVLRKTVGKSAR